MGKTNKKVNKKSKGNTKGKKKGTYVAGKDPIAVRAVFSFFIIFMILTFLVGIVSILILSSANNHYGLMFLGDKYYTPVEEYSTGVTKTNGGIYDSAIAPVPGKTVGFTSVTKGKICVHEGKFKGYKDGLPNIVLVEIIDMSSGKPVEQPIEINKASLLGIKIGEITSPIFMSLSTSPDIYLLVFASFVAATIVLGLIYFLVSPRGAKQLEKSSDEKKTVQTVTTVNSENSELLSHYLSTDDNIQPIDSDKNEVNALLNVNYYSSVRLHNGEVYTVVKKYQETVRRLEEYGASDMDLIKMNMIGNSEFDDLILNTHKERTMSMWEIIDFARTLDGVYCIKKRGTLNWTFKYKSKTLFILKRDDNDSEGYKVSIKVYPDAATKLNIIYKALEDSSFPIGPYWYMFNDLRNLPANVIKWLITESLNISKWQQTKADILRETPTLESYKLDVNYMRDMIIANTRELDMGKFMIITQNDTADNVKYDTVLETGFDDINMEQFTKEITMVVPNLNNVQMSLLTRKNASEALVTSLCNELLDFNTNNNNQSADPNGNLNELIAPSANKVVKRKKK